jgi:pimeloyl-ACP methyl ester carboxylesterase
MTGNYYIEYKKAILHYTLYGKGPKILLAFHGYGQDHQVFKCMERVLGEEYTIYSFDLFFHGKSKWPFKEQPVTKKFVKEHLQALLQREKIERFSVMGFSMGGKMALTAIEGFAEKIDEVYLLAADGVDTNFWYTLVTYPKPLRRFFRGMVTRPELFFRTVEIMGKTKLVHKSLIKFSVFQMNSLKKRHRVYSSWVNFRKLTFNIRHIAKLINQHGIKTKVYIGEFDRVITVKNMRKLTDKLKDGELHVLKTGHNGLVWDVAKLMSE